MLKSFVSDQNVSGGCKFAFGTSLAAHLAQWPVIHDVAARFLPLSMWFFLCHEHFRLVNLKLEFEIIKIQRKARAKEKPSRTASTMIYQHRKKSILYTQDELLQGEQSAENRRMGKKKILDR